MSIYPTESKKHTRIAWLMWFIAAIFYALDYFQHTAPSVLIKPIALELGSDIASIGNIMSIYFPIYAISQIPAGLLLDKYGVRLCLTLACLVVSAGLLIMSVSSETALIIGRVLIAIGSAFAFLGALKTAASWLPKNTFPIAVGLTNTIGVLGGILGQSLLNDLILRLDWQQAIMLIGLFGVMWAFVMLALLRSSQESRHIVEHEHSHWQVLTDKGIWLLAFYAGIMVGTVVNAFSELYDVVFLQASFKINSQQASLVSSMIFVGIAVGGPLHGWIARRFTYQKTWMVICAFATLLSFVMVICADLLNLTYYWLFVLYWLSGFFVSSMLLSFSVARCCYAKSAHATIFAVINMVIGLSGFFFQFLLGELLHYFSHGVVGVPSQQAFFYSLWFLIVPLLVSALLCMRIRRV